MATNPVIQQPDLEETYQNIFDLLGDMYWQASSIENKDFIFGVREEISNIIDNLDEQDLQNNAQALTQLLPKMTAANQALAQIQQDASKFTSSLSTAASVVAAISKVISLLPKV